MFEQELQFFIDNQTELVGKYQGQHIVIQESTVIGSYESAISAYIETKSQGLLGKAMIQHCTSGPEAYTASIATVGVVA